MAFQLFTAFLTEFQVLRYSLEVTALLECKATCVKENPAFSGGLFVYETVRVPFMALKASIFPEMMRYLLPLLLAKHATSPHMCEANIYGQSLDESEPRSKRLLTFFLGLEMSN